MPSFNRSKFFPYFLLFFLVVVVIVTFAFYKGVWHSPNDMTRSPDPQKASGWYSSGGTWSYRKQIAIDHTKVSGTSNLTDFPMLFSVTDTDLKFLDSGGKVASSKGLDILFASSDGTTKIPYEMDYYNSTTGQVIAWVKTSSLSPTIDTVIYVYFGNASASDQSQATSVWDSNYKGVWHLPDETTLSANDSTSNALNGTINRATATEGKIDGGAGFDGSNQDISVANAPSLGSALTLSAWVYIPPAPSANTWPVMKRPAGFGFFGFSLGASSDFLFWVEDNGGNRAKPSFTYSTGTWYFVTGTYNGTIATLYRDGIVASSGGGLAAGSNGVGTLRIGSQNGTEYFKGTVDEVRISNIVRSADWIKTEYNNQNSPSTFYSFNPAIQLQNPAAATA